MITFLCSNKHLAVAVHLAGKSVRCSSCNRVLEAPHKTQVIESQVGEAILVPPRSGPPPRKDTSAAATLDLPEAPRQTRWRINLSLIEE